VSADQVELTAPSVSVAKGHLTDEELAAVVAIVSAISRGRGRPRPPSDSAIAGGWNSYFRTVRRPAPHGAFGWRGSFRI